MKVATTLLSALFISLVVVNTARANEAKPQSDDRCETYCLLDQEQVEGKYIVDAQHCQSCQPVTLECNVQIMEIDGANCSNCKGTCTGRELPSNCVIITQEEAAAKRLKANLLSMKR